MKKVLALLLAFSMLFVMAACEGGNKTDDKDNVIKPSANEEDIYIHDNTWGDIKLLRVTTESRQDASELLELIKKYLTSLGMNYKIKSLYIIPNVTQDYAEEILPVRVYFDDASIDYIYVSVLVDKTKYTPGKVCVGNFRDSDVVNNEYIETACWYGGDFNTKLANDLGIGNKRPDVSNVSFPLYMTRDLSFEVPTKIHHMLMQDTISAFYKYIHADWSNEFEPGVVIIDGNYYQKLISDTIKSLDDLNAYLKQYFTEFVAWDIEAFYGMTQGDYPIYLEKDGAIYVCPIGIGGPIGYIGPEVKYVAEKDGYLFMIIEGSWTEFDDDFNPINPYFTYDMYVFEKDASGEWKCDRFRDIPYGRYETPFVGRP